VIVHVNGEPVEVQEGATVASVVERVAPERPRRGMAVAVDAEVVPQAQWDERPLAEGERVEVLTAVQGG
jgi:sulfur carrier protein